MEFDEVNEYLKTGVSRDASLSTVSFQQRLNNVHLVESLNDQTYQSKPIDTPAPVQQKRPSKAGMSRFVSNVRHFKRSNASKIAKDYWKLASAPTPTFYAESHTSEDDDDAVLQRYQTALQVLPERPPKSKKFLSRLKKSSRKERSHSVSGNEIDVEADMFLTADESGTELPKRRPSIIKKDTNQSQPAYNVSHVWQPRREKRTASVQGLTDVEPITGNVLVATLKDNIEQLQYLLKLEEQKIEFNKKEIIDYVEKLKQLDDDVELLDNAITQNRLNRENTMEHILMEANIQGVNLKNARAKHRSIIASIEKYNRGVDSTKQLDELQTKIKAAQRRDISWAWFKHWLFPTGKSIRLYIYIHTYVYMYIYMYTFLVKHKKIDI
ncbi:hypothetical protein J3Q64DRAFT_1735094 [Phycomyces blakesleeanus]|uniref:Uncharacterized protein n=1 Tax=Phycomyces blakesleeanus TaxID=4837 RepID=A0ABR3B2V2_PHYBL